MKKIVETLKNIWRIEDLRTRILITILFVAIYRFGSTVVLPGIDSTALANLQKQTEGGLMSLLDMFSGGAFSQASILLWVLCPTSQLRLLFSSWQLQFPISKRCNAKVKAERARSISTHAF